MIAKIRGVAGLRQKPSGRFAAWLSVGGSEPHTLAVSPRHGQAPSAACLARFPSCSQQNGITTVTLSENRSRLGGSSLVKPLVSIVRRAPGKKWKNRTRAWALVHFAVQNARRLLGFRANCSRFTFINAPPVAPSDSLNSLDSTG